MEPQYELEEGEVLYDGLDDADDTSIDPDIALSYLDEKVQSVLGHFQKDFEGGVSAENLGAKFGGYGSFLPTYQCSPSVFFQPKSPPRFHALSYLDKKVQNVLGKFQKDFEGGVSAENLGAKFGGYGSFLPTTYQRSPSVLFQPKSPSRFHSHNMTGSPKHLVTESAHDSSSLRKNSPGKNRAQFCSVSVYHPYQ